MTDWKFRRRVIYVVVIAVITESAAIAETKSIVLLNPGDGISTKWQYKSFGRTDEL